MDDLQNRIVECISDTMRAMSYAIESAYSDLTAPSNLYKPTLKSDGTQWCALLGENLQEGVSGFGDTPHSAMRAFDKAWLNSLSPDAMLLKGGE